MRVARAVLACLLTVRVEEFSDEFDDGRFVGVLLGKLHLQLESAAFPRSLLGTTHTHAGEREERTARAERRDEKSESAKTKDRHSSVAASRKYVLVSCRLVFVLSLPSTASSRVSLVEARVAREERSIAPRASVGENASTCSLLDCALYSNRLARSTRVEK